MPLTAQKTYTTGALILSADSNIYLRDWMNASPMALATAANQLPLSSAVAPAAVTMLAAPTLQGSQLRWNGSAIAWARDTWYDVTDYGADATGATNSSVAVQAAFDAAGNGTVYFPKGAYKFNVNVNYRPRIVGAGIQATTVRSYATGANAPFTLLDASPGWLHGEIRDMTIAGVSATEGYGVQFGHTAYVTYDELIGRWRFVNLQFAALQWGVVKLYGNIANSFERCVFGSCQHAVHAVDRPTGMHAGYDVYHNCWFATASLAAVYYDSSRSDTGILVFRACGFEGNTGAAIYLKNFNSQATPGVIIEDCWFESNGAAFPVTIDGASIGYVVNLVNCPAVAIKRCGGASILLANSNLTFEDQSLDNVSINADGNSSVVADAAHLAASAGTIPTILSQWVKWAGAASATGPVFRLPARNKVSTEVLGKVLASVSGTIPATWTGAANRLTSTVADGCLFPACQELTFAAGSAGEVHPTAFNVASSQYLAWTAEVKLQSGSAPLGLVWGNGGSLTAHWLPVSSRWTTFGGVIKTAGALTAMKLYTQCAADGTTVLRFGAWQVVSFSTLQEAVEFIESRQFAFLPPDPARVFHGTAAPTTGTWAVGDTVWNTAGANPVGWRCTVAGTPGTWTALAAALGCRVYRSANQAIPNITSTAISWDAESVDASGWHETVTNPTRITPILAGGGWVRLTVNALWNGGGGPQTGQNIQIKKNGVVVDEVDGSALYTGLINVNGSTDYLEAFIYQGGGALNLAGGGGAAKSYALCEASGLV